MKLYEMRIKLSNAKKLTGAQNEEDMASANFLEA